jgi:hypothetical protein
LKIFGIGLNKTGTKTLRSCLEKFGFSHKSFDFDLFKLCKKNGFHSICRTISDFDSFEDWPYPLYIKELDEFFPGSKFILTRRLNAEVWLDSLASHSLVTDPEKGMIARTLAYGYPYPHCNPKYFVDFYNNHLAWARNYFEDRDDDFLEVCWEDGDDWSILCRFLGLSLPQENFPHANKRRQQINSNVDKNMQIIRLFGHFV